MKNINKYILFFSLLLVLGCEEEYADFTAPDDLTDVSWIVGLDQNRPSREAQFKINANTHVPFMNLAQGATRSEWIIEEGNYFLETGFKTSDTLDNFIDEDLGTSMDHKKAFILFKNSGTNTVRLINKFKEPTTPTVSGNDSLVVKIDTYEENGEYVVDTKFIFDVYAEILPAFSVLQNGNEIINVSEDDIIDINDQSTWPIVEVEAASSLTFKDNTTTGRPNRAEWKSAQGVPNQIITDAQTETEIKFYKLGTYNAGTLRSFRFASTDNPVPSYSAQKIIPLKVKVVQSTQPFVYDGALSEAANQTISFRVTGEVLPFTGQESNFTVHVNNPTSGFNQDIPVQTAKVRASDATFIELSLAAPIYNSDEVTVSYSGSTIESADNRILEPFGPELVQMHFGNNVLPANSWASFELTGGNADNAFASSKYWIPPGQGNGQYGDLIYERVTTKSYTGSASMRYQIPDVSIPLVNLFGFGLADNPNGLDAGTYQVSYWVFIEPGTTINTFRTEFGNPIYGYLYFDISTAPRGEWVKVTADAPLVIANKITSSEANRRTTLRILDVDNPGVTGPQEIYFDELSLVVIENRP
ncbi:hypothetical protein [Pseudotamlana carrageenivorans]|uniref:Uncharacterized protein n=1 Tax=Pseudotamlana carrageenivorans TaxID=2069432 RepID=A0A2I7SHV3_9FLAO|nr:hypothetical protein [Tamlana carrageenivorans]AUS05476.1 hypothetical protein C1A40_08345 [Tamlana carrageenivorans]